MLIQTDLGLNLAKAVQCQHELQDTKVMRLCKAVGGSVIALFASLAWGQEPNQTEPTLPPVIVRPQPSTPYYYQPGDPIPWSSNAIQDDSTLVGPYDQPVWTTQRPFANSRVYVLPAGQAQVEQWVRPTFFEDGKPEFRFL